MGSFASMNRRVKALKKKARNMKEANPILEYDFSKVPTEILKRIAYPGQFDDTDYTDEELAVIFKQYGVTNKGS